MSDVFTVKGTVSLDTSDLHDSVDKAVQEGQKLADGIEKQTSGIQSALQNAFSFSVGDLISNGVQAGLQQLKQFATESISMASSLQEVQNVVDVTFGDGARQLEQWATNARTQFGLTELQAKQYASTMGAMLKSMGMGEKEVYSMSTAMAGLAADMASFYNLDFDEAFTKIRSGISGETEPLKQLGINLSVANLEAYALSQGITKTYDSMTQAEQAMLRYNYLLGATADAQGDFARTSDSYANNLRTLETNIDSLKAALGQKLLPIINEGITALNGLFDNERSLTAAFADADATFEANAESIAVNDLKAQSLINTLDKLSQKESLTEAETVQWNDAVSRLVAIYPSLSGMIGTTTGELNTSIEAIRGETEALKENALEKAKAAALQGKVDAWAAAAVELPKLQNEYQTTYDVWYATRSQLIDVEQQMADAIGMTVDEMHIQQAAARLSNASFEEHVGLTQEQKAAYSGLVTSYNELLEKERTQSKVASDAFDALEAQTEAVNAAKVEMEEATVFLEGFGEAAEDASGGAGNLGEAIAETAYSATDAKTVLEGLVTEGENVAKMFDELEQYKLANFDSIKKKVEGVYGTFDKADKVRKTSAKKMLGNLDSQIEQLDRFQTAYNSLKDSGASDTLLSQFDFSAESIAQMEALLKGGTDSIESANTKVDELQAKQSAVASSLSETALSVDTQYQTMMDTADAAAEKLRQNHETILSNAELMQSTVVSASADAEAGVDSVQTVGDILGESEWNPEIEAQDNATRIINDVKSKLEKLDGKRITTYIDLVTSKKGGSDDGTGHATGLDYVPYDEYAARLHKGEAVLTKAEADNWRKGDKASVEQPINVTMNMNGVSSNPYDIANEVRNALELMRWQA